MIFFTQKLRTLLDWTPWSFRSCSTLLASAVPWHTGAYFRCDSCNWKLGMERFDNWGTVWPFSIFAQERLHRFWEGEHWCLGMRVDLKESCSAEKQLWKWTPFTFRLQYLFPWILNHASSWNNVKFWSTVRTWICPDVYQILNSRHKWSHPKSPDRIHMNQKCWLNL